MLPAPSECVVQPGASVVELKYCEMCGRSFLRRLAPTQGTVKKLERLWLAYADSLEYEQRRDFGQKMCGDCISMAEFCAEELERKQEAYKEQLPDMDKIHRSAHPIRYKVERRKAAALTKLRRFVRADIWLPGLIEALKKSPMTYEQMAEVVPVARTPHEVCIRLKHLKVRLVRVGSAERRVPMGKVPGLFALEGYALPKAEFNEEFIAAKFAEFRASACSDR